MLTAMRYTIVSTVSVTLCVDTKRCFTIATDRYSRVLSNRGYNLVNTKKLSFSEMN